MAKDKKTQSKPAVSAETAKPAETNKAVENVKPVEEVKAAPVVEKPAVEKKAEKPVVEKKVEKLAAEKKAEKPVAEKKAEKPASKKAEPVKQDIFLIQGSGEYTVAKVTELCKADFKNKYGRKQIKSIDIYVKAENGELRAYYVVNGNPEGSIVL